MAVKRMHCVDDAQNVLLHADAGTSDATMEDLLQAGVTLLDEVRRLNRELERANARARASVGRVQPIHGHDLVEGMDPGGSRHFLAGLAVHAGTPLYLLAEIGWIPGWYEWNYEPATPARFHFRLAGVYEPVSIPIPQGAQLAWLHDVEQR